MGGKNHPACSILHPLFTIPLQDGLLHLSSTLGVEGRRQDTSPLDFSVVSPFF